jgi:hypothetical protein
MPWVGFEPTIPVFQMAKTFHALDSTATFIGDVHSTLQLFQIKAVRCNLNNTIMIINTKKKRYSLEILLSIKFHMITQYFEATGTLISIRNIRNYLKTNILTSRCNYNMWVPRITSMHLIIHYKLKVTFWTIYAKTNLRHECQYEFNIQ